MEKVVPYLLYERSRGAQSSLPYLKDYTRFLSFAETGETVACILAGLVSRGIRRGDRVALLAENSTFSVLLLLALQALGASLAPLHVRQQEKGKRQQLDLANPALLLCDTTEQHFAQSASCASETVQDFQKSLSKDRLQLPQHVSADDESLFLFSSGSSGRVKGVSLSHGAVLASAQASNHVTELSCGDVWLASLPLYHVGGIMIPLRCLLASASLFLIPCQKAVEIAAHLGAKTITHLSLVPTMLRDIFELRDDAWWEAPLKCLLLGGGPLWPSLQEQIEKRGVPARMSYGMTELCSHVTCSSIPGDCRSSGPPLPGVQVRIASPGTGEQELVGPVEVCAPFRATFVSPFGGEKETLPEWFRTGDIGRLTGSGELVILGREDDMFVSGGENVFAGEIEEAIREMPEVGDAAAFPVLDERWGHRAVLFVEARADVSEEMLKSFLRERLPSYKQPKKISLIDEMPRISLGKVDREKLRDLLKN